MGEVGDGESVTSLLGLNNIAQLVEANSRVLSLFSGTGTLSHYMCLRKFGQ